MHPKTPRDPLASGLEAWGCPVGLWGSARARGQASPGTPHPGDCRVLEVGDPNPGSPQLRGELPALEPCLQARGLGQSSQLRGLAALLLPGNRGRGGASRQLMGCPSQRVYTRGGTHPGTPRPAPPPPGPWGRLLPAAAVPIRSLLFCSGEQGGRSRARCLQPPLGREFILL